MANLTNVSYLKLVPNHSMESKLGEEESDSGTEQCTLFPMADSSQMIFLNTGDLGGEEFLHILKSVSPRFLIDLRIAPRFDYGKINRKQAFKVFAELQMKYFDVAGLMGISSKRDAQMNPGLLVDFLNTKLMVTARLINGPIVFLFDEKESMSLAADIFPKHLKTPEQTKCWNVFFR